MLRFVAVPFTYHRKFCILDYQREKHKGRLLYFPACCMVIQREEEADIEMLDLTMGQTRGLQRDVVYLGWPMAPSYMSPNAREWGSCGFKAVHRSPNNFWRSNSIFNIWVRVRGRRHRISLMMEAAKNIPYRPACQVNNCCMSELPQVMHWICIFYFYIKGFQDWFVLFNIS